MRVHSTTLLVLIMFALITLLILFTVALSDRFVKSVRKVYKALAVAMANDRSCKEFLGMCPVKLNPDSPPPNVSVVEGGDNKLALYALQLVFITGEGKKLADQRMKGITPLDSLYVSSHKDDNICRLWTSNQGPKNEKILWIAIRGTSNLTEAVIDLNTDQVSSFADGRITEKYGRDGLLVPIPLGAQGSAAADEQIVSGVEVHYGFYSVYKAIQKALVNHIETQKPDYIVMGSHSLGAAVATIAGLELIINNAVKPAKLLNYTFAAPRSGNPKYAQLVDSKVPNLYRYYNTSDLIPTLPLAVMPNWTNISPPYEFAHAGYPVHFTYNGGSVANNHSTGTYQKGIQYLADNSKSSTKIVH